MTDPTPLPYRAYAVPSMTKPHAVALIGAASDVLGRLLRDWREANGLEPGRDGRDGGTECTDEGLPAAEIGQR